MLVKGAPYKLYQLKMNVAERIMMKYHFVVSVIVSLFYVF